MKNNIFINIIIGSLYVMSFNISVLNASAEDHFNTSLGREDQKLVKWMIKNVSPSTGMPLSFSIPDNVKHDVYTRMGKHDDVGGIIERLIVEEGLEIYDGAVSQIVFSMLGGEENVQRAYYPLEVYWKGTLGELNNIRAGYENDKFIYDPNTPNGISADIHAKGQRGFIFRIINANGNYNSPDPLDGKEEFAGFPSWPTVHWEDWKPVAGENAWVVMAALQLYHKKYFNKVMKEYTHPEHSLELRLAKELARAAILLQSETGGIRMAPMGTYHEEKDNGDWWFNQISTENNLSWYAAFRMLYEITSEEQYKTAMKGIERYLKTVWNKDEGYFYQGIHYDDNGWSMNDKDFALDVQTWGICVLGPKVIDEWFNKYAAYNLWQYAKKSSGVFNTSERLIGVGFTEEHDRVSVEWTAGAIMAARSLYEYYHKINSEVAFDTFKDANNMRDGIDLLKKDLSGERAAYSYSSKRGWIPFGWYSHEPEVLSLASTAWVVLVDSSFNPFFLPTDKNASSKEEKANTTLVYLRSLADSK